MGGIQQIKALALLLAFHTRLFCRLAYRQVWLPALLVFALPSSRCVCSYGVACVPRCHVRTMGNPEIERNGNIYFYLLVFCGTRVCACV